LAFSFWENQQQELTRKLHRLRGFCLATSFSIRLNPCFYPSNRREGLFSWRPGGRNVLAIANALSRELGMRTLPAGTGEHGVKLTLGGWELESSDRNCVDLI